MWDPLPEDVSAICQDPKVQALVGYVQGGEYLMLRMTQPLTQPSGFNTTIDLALTYLAGLEIWQFLLRTSSRG